MTRARPSRGSSAAARVSSSPPSSRRRRPPVPRGSPLGAPDVRDGLTHLERIVLWKLDEVQRELPGKGVPTATLYGRVVEHVDVGEAEFLRVLQRLTGTRR